jgi:hypothetical protein
MPRGSPAPGVQATSGGEWRVPKQFLRRADGAENIAWTRLDVVLQFSGNRTQEAVALLTGERCAGGHYVGKLFVAKTDGRHRKDLAKDLKMNTGAP